MAEILKHSAIHVADHVPEWAAQAYGEQAFQAATVVSSPCQVYQLMIRLFVALCAKPLRAVYSPRNRQTSSAFR